MIAAVTTTRDEVDVVADVVTHLFAEGVDRVYVADDSSDGTFELLADMASRLPIVLARTDSPETFLQSRVMTELARQAAGDGAEWIIPFDADEIWYSLDGRPLADALADVTEPAMLVDVWEHVPQDDDDSALSPVRAMVWRRPDPWQPGWRKVAFRWFPALETIWQGNHWVTPTVEPVALDVLGIRHFPFRTVEQVRRKQELRHFHIGEGEFDPATVQTIWESVSIVPDRVHDPAPVRA